MRTQQFILLVTLLLTFVQPSIAATSDEAAVTRLYKSYGEAWLRNDDSVPAAVVGLFSSDAAILPHHGDPIVTPRTAIADHWFPGGEVFGTVERYEQHVSRVEVHGDLAYVFGRFALAFTFEGKQTQSEGNQLMVARRDAGEWKIAALTWNDPPQQ
jgi:uncharacterized protein (TIGR02246 family)